MTVLIRVRRIVGDDARQLRRRKLSLLFGSVRYHPIKLHILVKVLRSSSVGGLCRVECTRTIKNPSYEGIFALQQFRNIGGPCTFEKQQQ